MLGFCNYCFDNWSNERIICQICWNNRGNDVEIWNRIIGNFFGTIDSALHGRRKKKGENNGWNAPVTKENGRGELAQKERRKESLPGCVTTAMVVHVGREAAHTPSHFSVFSSIPDATHTDGGGVKGKGRGREENTRGGGEEKHTM